MRLCSRVEIKQPEYLLQHTARILTITASNPSNPKFNHYLFETIALLIRAAGKQAESTYLPLFLSILSAEIPDFSPYVLQLIALLLDINGLNPQYSSILPPLLQPPAWELYSNIPALVSLLGVFIKKDPSTHPKIGAFLGLFFVNKVFLRNSFNPVQTVCTASPFSLPSLTLFHCKLYSSTSSRCLFFSFLNYPMLIPSTLNP